MRPPIFDILFKLDTPPATYWLESSNGNIILKSDMIRQPFVQLFPELKIENKEWIYQRGNSLIEYKSGDTTLKKVEEFPGDVYYVYIDDKIEYIKKIKDSYIFQDNVYTNLIKYLDKLILYNNKDFLLIYRGKILNFEKPKSINVSKNNISLVYDGMTKVIDNDLNVDKYSFEGYVLGKASKGLIVKSLSNKILLNGNVIGYCQDLTAFLGEISNNIIILCGPIPKIYRENGWMQLNISSVEYRSFINSNFMILGNHDKTLIFDNQINLIYTLNPSVVIADSKKLYAFSDSHYFGVINTLEIKDIIKILRHKNTSEFPIKLAFNKFYDISYDKSFLTIDKKEKDNNVIMYLEPKKFEDGEVKIFLQNPFYHETYSTYVESEKPLVNFNGKILHANKGKVINTDFNALLEGYLDYKIPSRFKNKLRLSIGKNNIYYDISSKNGQIYVSEPIDLTNFEDNIILSIYIEREDLSILLKEFLLPIVRVEPNSDITRIAYNYDNIRKVILREENGKFVWDRVFLYPNFAKGILVAPAHSSLYINNSRYYLKKGINEICTKIDSNKRCFTVIGIDNPIEKLLYKVESNYLIITPIIKYYSPIEVYYGLHVYRGFPVKIIFPIDPAYNTVVIRVYIGNKKFVQKFTLDSLRISLNVAKILSNKLYEYMHSFGIL